MPDGFGKGNPEKSSDPESSFRTNRPLNSRQRDRHRIRKPFLAVRKLRFDPGASISLRRRATRRTASPNAASKNGIVFAWHRSTASGFMSWPEKFRPRIIDSVSAVPDPAKGS